MNTKEMQLNNDETMDYKANDENCKSFCSPSTQPNRNKVN